MIELKDTGSAALTGEFDLVIDGVAAIREREFSCGIFDDKVAIDVYDFELGRKILGHSFSDLPEPVFRLDIPLETKMIEDLNFVETIYIDRDLKELGHYSVNFQIDFEFEDWKKFWSASDYGNAFAASFNQFKSPSLVLEFEDDEFVSSGFTISCEIKDAELLIRSELFLLAGSMRLFHERTLVTLASQSRSDSVTTLFDFPEEVKVPCEQYLLYFVQFLKDLGVEASAELRHQGGQVLFAVTPSNKDEALDKIRAALETYLNLPMGNLSGSEGNATLQQLASNIYHLKSQLALAHAVLQAKDATIHAQRLTLVQQEHLLSGEVIVDSLRQVRTKKDENEPVLDGMAEITKYEGKGFSVNLPEIYRRPRELFKEEQRAGTE